MKKRIILSISIVVVIGIVFLLRKFLSYEEPVGGCCKPPSCYSSDSQSREVVSCPAVCYPCPHETRLQILLNRILNRD